MRISSLLFSFFLSILFVSSLGALPQITSASEVFLDAGKGYSLSDPIYSLTATENPNWFEDYTLPAGLVLDKANGIVYGQLVESGYFPVDFEAQVNGVPGPKKTVQFVSRPAIYSGLELSGSYLKSYPESSPLYGIQATGSPNWFTVNGLPAGLNVNRSTGTIYGKPSEIGTFSITLETEYNGIVSLSKVLSLEIIDERPVVTSASSVTVILNDEYGNLAPAYQLTATRNPTWFIAENLPPGMWINSETGAIGGIPTSEGVFTASLVAEANGIASAVFSLTLTVDAKRPVITSGSLARGTLLKEYTEINPLYRVLATENPDWFVAAGLPGGLWIASQTGEIGGIPTEEGSFEVFLRAERNGVPSATFSLTIEIIADRPEVTSPSEVEVLLETTYDSFAPAYQITATNNPNWFIASGLPLGLSLDSENGRIVGWAEVVGTFDILLQAEKNSVQSEVFSLSMTVLPRIPQILNGETEVIGQLDQNYLTGINPLFQLEHTEESTEYLLTGGTLPIGLFLNTETGEIVGNTWDYGSFPIQLRVKRYSVVSDPLDLTLIIPEIIPDITSAASAEGKRNVFYNNAKPLHTITHANTATWFDYTGTMPAGIDLNRETGKLVGNTWQTGTFPLTLLTRNKFGIEDTQDFSLKIVPDTPTITSALEIEVPQGIPFFYTIEATENPTFFFAEGLPRGLKGKLNGETGEISGIPLESGVFTVTVSAASLTGTRGSATLTLTVTPGAVAEFTVTNTSGDQSVENSLPWAVLEASYNSIASVISFNLPGDPPYVIILQNEAMFVNEQTIIDATTQAGYVNQPVIQLDVNGLESGFILVNNAVESEVRGFQIYNFIGNAIATQPGADGNTIRDNWIGFRSTPDGWWRNFEAGYGTYALSEDPYILAPGIGLQSSHNKIIGNVISGVHNGISIGYDFESKTPDQWGPVNVGNEIRENIIGLTPDGTAILTNTAGATSYVPDLDALALNPLGTPEVWAPFGNNSDGVYLAARAQDTVISNNWVGGNFSVGLELLHDTVFGTIMYGNRIGLDMAGMKAMPNGELGIIISNYSHDNIVGGEYGPNWISGNRIQGINLGGENSFFAGVDNLIEGNYIGLTEDLSGTVPNRIAGIFAGHPDTAGNVIRRNVIGGNLWGIYLDDSGPTLIEENWIGITEDGLNVGNDQDGIALETVSDITILGNLVQYNGFNSDPPGPWGEGLWFFDSEAEDNTISGNDFVSNFKPGLVLFSGPIVLTPPEANAALGETFNLHLDVTESVDTGSISTLPEGLFWDDASLTLSGNPREIGEFQLEITLANAYGTHSFVLDLTIEEGGEELVWIESLDSGGDWYLSDWFGFFFGGYFPLVYHSAHGFVFAGNSQENNLVFFDSGLDAWVSWGLNHADFLFIYSGNPRWLYWDSTTSFPARRFWDFELEAWVTESEI